MPLSADDKAAWVWAVHPNDDAAWSLFWTDPHKKKIVQDDMSVEDMEIVEESSLIAAIEGRSDSKGLWFGGQKYTITVTREQGLCQTQVTTKIILAVREEMGVCIVAPIDYYVVIGMYDENQGQHAGACMKSVLTFATQLID